MSELDWIKFSLLSNCQSTQCLVSGIVNVLALSFPRQNDKSSTPGLKSNTPTPRNDAPTPGTSSTPGLRPILGKPPGMEALGWYRSLSSLATELIFYHPLPVYCYVTYQYPSPVFVRSSPSFAHPSVHCRLLPYPLCHDGSS